MQHSTSLNAHSCSNSRTLFGRGTVVCKFSLSWHTEHHKWTRIIRGDGDKLGEVVHVVGSAPQHKQLVGQVIDVIPSLVVGIEECLCMPLNALDRVCMSEQCCTRGRNPPWKWGYSAETMNRAWLTWKQSMRKQMWSSDIAIGNRPYDWCRRTRTFGIRTYSNPYCLKLAPHP
jgi:hypothetical protein